MAILDSMQEQTKQLSRLNAHLLDAGKLVSSKRIAEHV
jgi:hypothetical protein